MPEKIRRQKTMPGATSSLGGLYQDSLLFSSFESQRQLEPENRTFALLTMHANMTSLAFNDGLADVEAKTQTSLRGMNAATYLNVGNTVKTSPDALPRYLHW